MTRIYKLAANFNTVEFEIDDDFEFMDYLTDDEILVDDEGDFYYDIPVEKIIPRVLQREYDILASIKVINVAPEIKQAKEITPPSEKQAKWAENLGMKDPMKHDKREVWEYIQKHKNDK